jgi:hypothetical protein
MNGLDNLKAGFTNVGVAHAIATAENNRGFASGAHAGMGKGVLMTLDCAKNRFGSKLMRLLSEEVERRHGEELLNG